MHVKVRGLNLKTRITTNISHKKNEIMALMVKVEFRCPTCNKVGKLDVDEELLKKT